MPSSSSVSRDQRLTSDNPPTVHKEPPRLPNPYRQYATSSLKANLETRLWDRADIAADLEADPASWTFGHANLDFCDAQIELIVEELDRRERLRHRSDSPPWPIGTRRLGPDKDRIKAEVSIEAYLERRGVLLNRHRSGRAMALCPLPGHDDATASFSIDTIKQLWHCFGCGRGGDVIALHQHMVGDTDFIRAILDLAEEAGIGTETRHAS